MWVTRADPSAVCSTFCPCFSLWKHFAALFPLCPPSASTPAAGAENPTAGGAKGGPENGPRAGSPPIALSLSPSPHLALDPAPGAGRGSRRCQHPKAPPGTRSHVPGEPAAPLLPPGVLGVPGGVQQPLRGAGPLGAGGSRGARRWVRFTRVYSTGSDFSSTAWVLNSYKLFRDQLQPI